MLLLNLKAIKALFILDAYTKRMPEYYLEWPIHYLSDKILGFPSPERQIAHNYEGGCLHQKTTRFNWISQNPFFLNAFIFEGSTREDTVADIRCRKENPVDHSWITGPKRELCLLQEHLATPTIGAVMVASVPSSMLFLQRWSSGTDCKVYRRWHTRVQQFRSKLKYRIRLDDFFSRTFLAKTWTGISPFLCRALDRNWSRSDKCFVVESSFFHFSSRQNSIHAS